MKGESPAWDVSSSWEQHADDWIAWARAPNHDAFWSDTWPTLEAVLPAPRGVTVDLGCGEGRSARQLTGLGYSVVGIERSPTLAHAAASGGEAIPVVRADSAALPIGDENASLVLACMSLQDVDDLENSVDEIARVLGPGGVLCAAIVHPFNSAEDEATMRSGRFDVSAPYLEPRRYELEIESDGLTMRFVSMHRPLGAYFDALRRNGMAVTQLREGGDGVVPWLLVFRAEKFG
jgi:SAM-dependent methyltransferase